MPALPPLSRSGRRKLVKAVQSPTANSLPPGISTHGEASVRRDRAAVQSALDENASSAAGRQLSKLLQLRSGVISNMERLIRRHHEATDMSKAARTYRSQLERAGLGGELSPGMNPAVAAVLLTIFALIEMVAFHNALLLGFGLNDETGLDKVESWLFALLSVSVVFLGAHSGRHAKYAVQRLTLSRRLDRAPKPSLMSRVGSLRRGRGSDRSGSDRNGSALPTPSDNREGDRIDPADRLPELDPRSEFTPRALRGEASWDILHWIGAGTFAMAIIFASAELRRFGLAGNGLEQPAPMVFVMISSAVLMAAWVVEYSAANHWFKAVHGLDKQARKAERGLRSAEQAEAKSTGQFDSLRVQLFAMLSVVGARAGYEGEIAEQIVHESRGDAAYNAPWHPINRERVGMGFLPGLARLTPPFDPSDLSPDLLWQIAADRAQSPYADAFLRRQLKTATNGDGSLVEDIIPMQPTAQRLLWPSSMVVPDGWEPPQVAEVAPTQEVVPLHAPQPEATHEVQTMPVQVAGPANHYPPPAAVLHDTQPAFAPPASEDEGEPMYFDPSIFDEPTQHGAPVPHAEPAPQFSQVGSWAAEDTRPMGGEAATPSSPANNGQPRASERPAATLPAATLPDTTLPAAQVDLSNGVSVPGSRDGD
jgi:hypothetical protein